MPAKPATPRGTSTGTTTKAAATKPAAAANKTSAATKAPPSATNTNTNKAATGKATKRATSASPKPKKGGKKSVSKANASAAITDVDISATTSASKAKKAKPLPVGNLYLPVHNLSFGSNPLKSSKAKSKGNSDDVNTSAQQSLERGESQQQQQRRSSSAGNYSFHDPATIFATSPSRVAAKHEQDRLDWIASRASSPVFDEDGNEIVVDNFDGVQPAADDASPSTTAPAEAPKFKSYFFGHPKPVVVPAANEAASPAREPAPTPAPTEGGEAPLVTDAAGTDETISREASPQPSAPKLVSFDDAIAIAEANQAATAVEGSAAPSSSASPHRALKKKKTGSKLGSKSKSPSTTSGGKKAKSKSKASSAGSTKSKGRKSKSKAGAHVDPEDCRPAGPIEKLFGDVAKSGLTGVPTLASLAIAARRTGSEVDLKAAANAPQQGTVVDTTVTPLQTATALFNLGWMHYHGLGGCGINYKKAYAYFYDAATKYDHPMAYYYLGLQLRDGKGVEKNLLAAHDGFQTSLALVGGSNVTEPSAADDTIIEANYKKLAMPAEKTVTSPTSPSGGGLTSADEGEHQPVSPAVTVLNETNKRPQSRLIGGEQLTFEGIDMSSVETVVNWQIGKLWAAGNVVVLEEAPKNVVTDAAAAGSTAGAAGPSRAASPAPVAPSARGTSTARGGSVSVTTTVKTKAAASPNAAAKKAKSASKAGGKTKKGGKKSSAKDPTNNTGGGPNVSIKQTVAVAADASGSEPSASPAADGTGAHAATKVVAQQFRKVRYGSDKPVAIALFERAEAAGFEHAGLAAEILRDVPIPRAELE